MNDDDTAGGEGTAGDKSLVDLEAEVAELRGELDEVKSRPKGRLRRLFVAILLVVATVLAVASNLVVWLERTVLDTDTYISTIEPLPQDPAVSEALATFMVEELYADLDLDAEIEGALPDDAGFLAGPMSTAIKTFSTEAATRLIQSDQFTQVWVEANRAAHSLAVEILEGGGDTVSTDNGEVTVNLQPAVQALAEDLGASDELGSLTENVDTENLGRFVLFSNDQLGLTQQGVEWLKRLRFVLPVLMVACYAGALWISPRRRRTVIGIGVSLITAMLATRLVLDLARESLLELPKKELGRNAVAAFLDIMARGLDSQTQMVLVLGILLVIGAAVMGPYRWAVSLRRLLSGAFTSAGEQVDEQPAWLQRLSSSVGPYRSAFMGGGVIAALVILWLWDVPTARVVLSLALLLLVYLGAVQFLAVLSGSTGDDDEDDQSSPGSPTSASPDSSTSTNRS